MELRLTGRYAPPRGESRECSLRDYLFQLVSARYEKSSLILTSNRSFTEWSEILDRLLHHSHVPSIRGQSYRLRDKLNVALLSPLAATLEGPAAPKGGRS